MSNTGDWEVCTGTRLHFGLLSFGGEGPQFGGAGVMLARPRVRLVVRATPGPFAVTGPASQRASEFAARWSAFHRRSLDGCALEVLERPPQHSGLGSGTQLGLAVAAGLNRFFELPESEDNPARLASSVRRGLRSAVGTYGFVQGGLIVEQGKLPGETLAPLEQRLPIPSAWRFLLLRPRQPAGLSGDREKAAFRQVPPVPAEVTQQLRTTLNSDLLPALERSDCQAFGDAVYRYGRLAGECFRAIQGSAYNGSRIAEMVQQLRAWGIRGVGQSSWGPTVFAVFADREEAEAACEQARRTWGTECERQIVSPLNRGAAVRQVSEERAGERSDAAAAEPGASDRV